MPMMSDIKDRLIKGRQGNSRITRVGSRRSINRVLHFDTSGLEKILLEKTKDQERIQGRNRGRNVLEADGDGNEKVIPCRHLPLQAQGTSRLGIKIDCE